MLLNIGLEALSVDWPVKDARCRQPIAAQRAHEGQRAPVTVRSKAAQALAAWSPTAQGRHVGLDPGFVDKNQPVRVKARLKRTPALTPVRYVGPGLFKGE